MYHQDVFLNLTNPNLIRHVCNIMKPLYSVIAQVSRDIKGDKNFNFSLKVFFCCFQHNHSCQFLFVDYDNMDAFKKRLIESVLPYPQLFIASRLQKHTKNTELLDRSWRHSKT